MTPRELNMTSHNISILTTHRHAPQVFSLAGQGIKGSDAQVPQKDCDSHVVKDRDQHGW